MLLTLTESQKLAHHSVSKYCNRAAIHAGFVIEKRSTAWKSFIAGRGNEVLHIRL